MDKVKLADLIREIADVAPQVAEEHAAQQAAFSESYQAQAKVLEEVMELARPALRAISDAIPMREERGVLLDDSWRKSVEPHGWGRVAELARLYLLTDGRLFWASRELDSKDEAIVAFYEASPQEVVVERNVVDIVARLHAALTKQIGKRGRSTERAHEEATKLKAILTLLE